MVGGNQYTNVPIYQCTNLLVYQCNNRELNLWTENYRQRFIIQLS